MPPQPERRAAEAETGHARGRRISRRTDRTFRVGVSTPSGEHSSRQIGPGNYTEALTAKRMPDAHHVGPSHHRRTFHPPGPPGACRGAANLRAVRGAAALSRAHHPCAWSGEACWIPLGSLHFGVGCENATSYPGPGQILLYPGGLSET